MTQKWIGALVAVALAGAVGCKKDLHTSSVASVLPSGVASKLSPELLAFVEVVPADVTGFGYIELGNTVDKLLPLSPMYAGMVDDFVEMAQRRWGLDPRSVRGAGVAVQQQGPVWFFDLGNANLAALNNADVSVVRVGKLTAIGDPAAVSAMAASGQRGEMLVKKRTAWVQHALSYAAGGSAFFSLTADQLVAFADEDEREFFASSEDLTGVIGAGGVSVHVTALPGKVGLVRGPIDTALSAAHAVLNAQLMTLPQEGPEALLAILGSHYGAALLAGVQVAADGDHVAVTMPWRSPELPATTPAPPLAERVVAPDEWAVAQLDLGAPIVQTLIAFTDVIGARLDRAKLLSELLSEVSTISGLPAMDPRTFTLSVGGMQGLISLHAAKAPMPRGVFSILGGVAVAAETPWGMVATVPDMRGTLEEALARRLAPMPLSTSSKVAAGAADTRLRVVVDFDRLPAMMKMVAGQIPVKTFELAASTHGFVATLVARPGQAAQLVGMVDLFKSAMMAEIEPKYRDRKSASAADEVGAIVAYRQILVLGQLLTPKVEGDRLTFAHELPMPDFSLVPWLGAFGVGAMATLPKQLREDAGRRAAPGAN